MKRENTIRLAQLVLALAMFGYATSAAAATGEFTRNIEVDEIAIVDVVTGSGNIVVTGSDSDKVVIHAKISAGNRLFRSDPVRASELVRQIEASPPVEVKGDHILIGRLSGWSKKRNIQISYEILVPRNIEVKADSGSGEIRVSHVGGPVKADTGSGKIRLEDIGGAVNSNSGSGSIIADGVAGAFEGHTGSGSIKLTQIAPGDVNVSTGSGSSELRGISGKLRAHSGSGRIVVDGQQNGPWKLDTGSGSIRIALPTDAVFSVDAKTSSGGISIEHPTTVLGKVNKRHLKGDIRGGGDLVHIRTGSGGITID